MNKLIKLFLVLSVIMFAGCEDIVKDTYMSPIGYEVYTDSNKFKYGSSYVDSRNDILNACKQYQPDKLIEVYLKCIDYVKVEDQARYVDECRDNAIDLVCINNAKFYEDMLEVEE